MKRLKRAIMLVLLALLALWPGHVRAASAHHTAHVHYHSQHGPSINYWAHAISWAAHREGISPYILGGLVYVESRGIATAGSSAGAIGLCQLLPGTANAMGVNPYRPWQNVLGGARYLRYLLDNFARGDIRTALAQYNGGPANPQYGYAAAVLAASV